MSNNRRRIARYSPAALKGREAAPNQPPSTAIVKVGDAVQHFVHGAEPFRTGMHSAGNPTDVSQLLESAQRNLAAGRISAGMELLANATLELRGRSDPAAWKAIVLDVCRTHEVFATLLLDPFTARSFYKPRGYPGDAVLLDLIYGEGHCDSLLKEATVDGRAIYQYSSRRVAPLAVRWRCRHIAQLIDDAAGRRGPLRILSIASGHARELGQCRAARSGGIKQFVALDTDPDSLHTLAQLVATRAPPLRSLCI